MMLDFLFEFFGDFSPFYLYVSVLLSAIYVIRWFPEFEFFFNKQVDIRNHYRLYGNFEPVLHQVNEFVERRNWLAIITKRIEVPDDDEEGALSSFYKFVKKRGGAQWKNNLYSLTLRKSAFSEAFYS
ncbi:hypothetical protein [Ornithinibacillus sp. FSL M8-0202]|uniref:hypothetical protein n=1 Tax=unclassified Ornithinibacillus TaxID=2620869 RepID=UPI0030D26E9C